MDAQQLVVPTTDGGELAVTRWPGTGPTVVLVHAGVADSRAWHGVGAALAADGLDVVAHDDRGHGASPHGPSPRYSPLVDLVTVLDALDVDRAVLVGNSNGAAVVADLALRHAHRVRGLVLLSPAVTGLTDDDTPFDWAPDRLTAGLLARADDRHATDRERLRALAHLWLDGPEAPLGRVAGEPRDVFEAGMLHLLRGDQPAASQPSGAVAWKRLREISAPTVTAWGDLDLPCDLPFLEETARRLDQGPGRVLPGVAHLPGLERPDLVAELVREVVARGDQEAAGAVR